MFRGLLRGRCHWTEPRSSASSRCRSAGCDAAV